MKKYIFILGCLYGQAISGQGLHPSNAFPCFEPYIFTTSHSGYANFDFESVKCLEYHYSVPPGIQMEAGINTAVAGEYIHIAEDMHISFNGTTPTDPGYGPDMGFHAYIGHNDFDIFWFEPNNTVGTVGKYEKLELGLRIPSTLKTSIENYVNDVATTDKINPFNPNEINVQADFYYLGTSSAIAWPPTKTVYGFYYKEFERKNIADLILLNDGWNEDSTSFPFRIRFAPSQEGNWAVKIKIVTTTQTLTALPVNFVCVPSANLGYVKVGSNNKFLQLGDKPFMPVGQNLVWPRCDSFGDTECKWVDAYASDKIAPASSFAVFEQYMQDLKDNGGNYFRLIITPWTFDVEFEDLGNYSYRLRNAMELDRIIKRAEELDLRIQLCLTVHYNFENSSFYTMNEWDWTLNSCPIGDQAYCYSDDLGLTVQQFFSNGVARNYYEKRLRYILSRINYSTAIGMYEIASEVNNFGTVVELSTPDGLGFCHSTGNSTSRPYHESSTFATAGKDWLIHFASYIKNDLGCDQHLLSTCYAGSPFDTPLPVTGISENHSVYDNGDNSILDDLFDVASYNAYATSITQNKGSLMSALDYTWGFNDGVHEAFDNIGKPTMHSETGQGTKLIDCNNNVEWIKTIYISPFTGMAATLNWDYSLRPDLWHHYAPVAGFLNMVLGENDIANEYWQPHYTIINTTDEHEEPQVEAYHLSNADYSTRAFGVVVNRTFNGLSEYNDIFVHDHECNNFMYNEDGQHDEVQNNYPTALEHRVSVADVDGAHELNLVVDNGDYTIEWYNMDGTHCCTQTEHVNIFSHKLELDFPDLDFSGTFNPIVFFKAYKDESRMMHITTDTGVVTLPIKQFKSCQVFPNPANTFKSVNINCNDIIVQVQLRDNAGKILHYFMEAQSVLTLPALQRGVYFIKVILYNGIEENHKIVVLD